MSDNRRTVTGVVLQGQPSVASAVRTTQPAAPNNGTAATTMPASHSTREVRSHLPPVHLHRL